MLHKPMLKKSRASDKNKNTMLLQDNITALDKVPFVI
jgi:hypothetical protein